MGRGDQIDTCNGSHPMVGIAAVQGIGQHIFRANLPDLDIGNSRDQGLGITLTGSLNSNMGDEIEGLFFFLLVFAGTKGFHDLDLVTLPLVATVGGIRIRWVLQGV